MQSDGVRKSAKIGKRMLKRVFCHWHFYFAVITYVTFQCTTWVGGQMGLWVKSTHQYSVELINILPTGTQLLAIVVGVLIPQFAMVYPIWMPFTFAGIVLLFCNICLRIWSIPIGLKFASWFLLGFNSCMTPMIFPFVHVIMKDDNEAKSFTTGAMMTVGWAFFSWYNVVVFPVTEAPQFARGFTASICLISIYITLFVTGYLLWQRDIRRGLYKNAIEEEENEEIFNEKANLAAVEITHLEEKKTLITTIRQLQQMSKPGTTSEPDDSQESDSEPEQYLTFAELLGSNAVSYPTRNTIRLVWSFQIIVTVDDLEIWESDWIDFHRHHSDPDALYEESGYAKYGNLPDYDPKTDEDPPIY
ncbi:hypothetical protein V491_08959 [Pseudogymnoascus sp. VKM F-3775]|nr:hypothetical protein V491_08959 [Pseudogymnoascus sp. VKM F-3775]